MAVGGTLGAQEADDMISSLRGDPEVAVPLATTAGWNFRAESAMSSRRTST
jgi:hypothetical protein